MKTNYSYNAWLQLVDQAYEKGKLTDEEKEGLLKDEAGDIAEAGPR
ncbi:MAG: hypothetical protein PUF17_04770 [Lactimicrobium massiliense]|nr:hypothetical protein [Lactimicrobium massiliense]MDD6560268.1 hypothetical protein [Lactimicrobium massiliense]